MNTPALLRAALVAALAGLALAACDRNAATTTPAPAKDATVGQKLDKAIDRTQKGLAKAGDAVEKAGDKAGDSLEKAGDKVADAAKKVSASDLGIVTSVKAAYFKDPDLKVLEIDVDAQDGVVTLTGKANSEAARANAEKLAAAAKGVKSVKNNVTVKK